MAAADELIEQLVLKLGGLRSAQADGSVVVARLAPIPGDDAGRADGFVVRFLYSDSSLVQLVDVKVEGPGGDATPFLDLKKAAVEKNDAALFLVGLRMRLHAGVARRAEKAKLDEEQRLPDARYFVDWVPEQSSLSVLFFGRIRATIGLTPNYGSPQHVGGVVLETLESIPSAEMTPRSRRLSRTPKMKVFDAAWNLGELKEELVASLAPENSVTDVISNMAHRIEPFFRVYDMAE